MLRAFDFVVGTRHGQVVEVGRPRELEGIDGDVFSGFLRGAGEWCMNRMSSQMKEL